MNEKLILNSKRNSTLKDLGTTLTVLVLQDSNYWIAHIGDTRAYLIGEESIERFTTDHSALSESIKEGLISETDASEFPYSNALTRYLGSEHQFYPDILPLTGSYEVKEGDIILLCSDGIHSVINDFEIYEQILYTENIMQAGENLLSLAYRNGSKDNMSVIILEFGNLRRKRPSLPLLPKIGEELLKRKTDFKRVVFLFVIFFFFFIVEGFLLYFLKNVISKAEAKVVGQIITNYVRPEESSKRSSFAKGNLVILEERDTIKFNIEGLDPNVFEFYILVYEEMGKENPIVRIPIDMSGISKELLSEKIGKSGTYYYQILGKSKSTELKSDLKAIEIKKEKRQ